MFNSLLNASSVSIDTLILDIFIILGVVIAGALIVYFVWEVVSSVVNKDKKESSVKEPNFGPKQEEKKEDVVVVENYSLDQEETKEEEQKNLLDESKMTEVDEEKAEEEKTEAEDEMSEEERANAERRAYLEARRQELIARMQEEMDDEEETEEQHEESEEESEVEEEPEVEEVEETEEVQEESKDDLDDERAALQAEKERYEAMVQELEAAKKALSEEKVVTTTVVTNGVLSLDELKARLADAEERLKTTEKEFKQCKKEYTPLHRIWKTHERDEKKLRRKEALVAKQKVILYGVNNYADIDEDKAKKLAEDLDLLDGLKLSVQHCEEVMKENQERYPLLQRMYGVLSQRNEELKADIEYYKSEIAKLEEEKPDQE